MSAAITPLVDAFPEDDKEYLVWAFGCLKKNTSDKSITPLIEVALTEIRHTGKLAAFSESYFIPVTELDMVCLWSVWKNKKRQDKNWGEKETDTASFKFDLSDEKIEALEFFSKRPDTEKYYIPNDLYNFNKLDKRLPRGRREQRRHYFSQAKITKLITWRGCEVLIPSLELFSSIYTPFEKEIRRKLLTKSFDDVISDYVNMNESSIDGNDYNISLKVPKDDSNIVFLAYLALNPITRSRVSKLWSSLMAGEGDYFTAISPYHPKDLEIKAEGLWLEKGKSFLVLRIKEFTLPEEFNINVVYPEIPRIIKKRSNTTKKRRNNYIQHEIKEMALTSEFDPGIIHSQIYLSSDVRVKPTNLTIVEKRRPSRNTKDITSSSIESYNNLKDSPNFMSSGSSTYSKDNLNTAGVKIEYKNFNQKNIMEVVYKTLVKIKDDQKLLIDEFKPTQISKIINYNEKGNAFKNAGYGKYPTKLLSIKKIGPWSVIKVNRKPKAIRSFLLSEIHLLNSKSAYLLEIQRSPSEQFSGLFFQIKDNVISKSNIEELLIAAASTKGRMTFHTESKNKTVAEIRQLTFIDKLYTFNHVDIENRMLKQIQEAISLKVFR